MRPDPRIEEVFLYRRPVDMRKQMDGLSAIVKDLMHQDPLCGKLYIFTNRRRNKLKVLFWERTGFVVWYKRLERHRFPWPKRHDLDTLTLTGQQLSWLLDGVDVWRMKPHEELKFLFAS